MRALIVENWTPEWAERSAAAQPPGSEGGACCQVETPKRPGNPICFPFSGSNLRFSPAIAPAGAGIADLESAAALLALCKGERPPRPKSVAPSTADRARPGPQPQSKLMGVTRHIKGMWNAQLWLPGQTRQEHVGGFPNTEAAAAAHDLAALIIKGPDAKINNPKHWYDGYWYHLRGQDWPALRKAIRKIVTDDLGLIPDPETVSPIGTPGPGRPLPVPYPAVGSKRQRDIMTPPNLPPAMRARSEDSPEPLISGLTGMSPDAPSAEEHDASPAANVRKSGRAREIPGRLIALNGEDPKLLHKPRRKRKRAMFAYVE